MKNDFIYNLTDLNDPFKLGYNITKFCLGLSNNGVEVKFILLANKVLKNEIMDILNKVNSLDWEIQITGSSYNESGIQLDSFILQPKNKLEINEFLEIQKILIEINKSLLKRLKPYLKNTDKVQTSSLSYDSKNFKLFSVIDKESIVVNYSQNFLQYSYPLISRLKHIKRNGNKKKFHIPLKELYEYVPNEEIKFKKIIDKLISKYSLK